LYTTINKTLARTETIEQELKTAEQALQNAMDAESQESKRVKDGRIALDTAQREQKELFLVIFQRFVMCLSEHLTHAESENRDPNTFWFNVTMGQMKAVGRKYHTIIHPYLGTLENLLFNNADARITSIFQQIKEC